MRVDAVHVLLLACWTGWEEETVCGLERQVDR